MCERTKYRRVKNIVQQLDENPGVEGALLKTLKRRDSEENDVSDEFKLAVLSLMKTLHLSKRKLNDLRFWIRDMIKRGMDLLSPPQARQELNPSQCRPIFASRREPREVDNTCISGSSR